MYLTHYFLLVLHLSILSPALSAPPWKSMVEDTCSLIIPNHVRNQTKPGGKPLIIFVHMKVLGVRNVPDSGGSYGLDVKWVVFIVTEYLKTRLYSLFLRIILRWQDWRYQSGCGKEDDACAKNWDRPWHCPSKDVLWNEQDPLWLPSLSVEDVLEVVSP